VFHCAFNICRMMCVPLCVCYSQDEDGGGAGRSQGGEEEEEEEETEDPDAIEERLRNEGVQVGV